MKSNEDKGVIFNQPRTMDERMTMARTFVDAMDIQLPTLVDDISNPANACYAAWPERIYIIDSHGKIIYKGGMGPDNFNLAEAEEFLGEYLKTPTD